MTRVIALFPRSALLACVWSLLCLRINFDGKSIKRTKFSAYLACEWKVTAWLILPKLWLCSLTFKCIFIRSNPTPPHVKHIYKHRPVHTHTYAHKVNTVEATYHFSPCRAVHPWSQLQRQNSDRHGGNVHPKRMNERPSHARSRFEHFSLIPIPHHTDLKVLAKGQLHRPLTLLIICGLFSSLSIIVNEHTNELVIGTHRSPKLCCVHSSYWTTILFTWYCRSN